MLIAVLTVLFSNFATCDLGLQVYLLCRQKNIGAVYLLGFQLKKKNELVNESITTRISWTGTVGKEL